MKPIVSIRKNILCLQTLGRGLSLKNKFHAQEPAGQFLSSHEKESSFTVFLHPADLAHRAGPLALNHLMPDLPWSVLEDSLLPRGY